MFRQHIAQTSILAVLALAGGALIALGPDAFPQYQEPIIFGALAFVVACLLALVYLFLIAPRQESQKSTAAVTSYNQSGGITAHKVNIGRQKLVLSDERIREVLEGVPRDVPVIVRAVGGRSAREMGDALHDALLKAGFEARLTIFSVMDPPPDEPLTITRELNETIVILAPNV